MMVRQTSVLAALLALVACQSKPEPVKAEPTDAGPAPAPSSSTPAEPEIRSRRFATSTEALEAAMEAKPRVLAIGEAHAQRGTEHLRSGTRRFTEDLLPELAARTSDLVLEAWVPDPKCARKKIKKVRKQQRAVTRSQAKSNQNEYVVMGKKARALGIRPHLLKPECSDYDAIIDAGAGDIDVMLRTIARLTDKLVRELLADNGGKMVITYGGALHNDVAPGEGREAWSFGPQLKEHTKGRYLALDIIVPEYIKPESPVWSSKPWVAAYQRTAKDRPAQPVQLFETEDSSLVLVFRRGDLAKQAEPK